MKMTQNSEQPIEPTPQIVIRSGESYLQQDGRELNLLFSGMPSLVRPANPPTVTMRVFKNAPDPERGNLASGFVFEQTFSMIENSASIELPAALTELMGHAAQPAGRLWLEFTTSLGESSSSMWLEVKE